MRVDTVISAIGIKYSVFSILYFNSMCPIWNSLCDLFDRSGSLPTEASVQKTHCSFLYAQHLFTKHGRLVVMRVFPF